MTNSKLEPKPDDLLKEINERKKPELDNFPGIVSSIFEKIVFAIKGFLESQGIIITGEAWFLISFLAYILIYFLSKNKTGIVLTAFILLLLNLIIPNIKWIKERFFSTDEEKLNQILARNNQDALNGLKIFFQSTNRISEFQLEKIYKKFPDTYEAYKILFKSVKLSEQQINFFIEKNLLLESFFDDTLMKLFLKSSRLNISQSCYMKMRSIIRTRKFKPETNKKFLYKYCIYTNMNSTLKTIVSNFENLFFYIDKYVLIIFFSFLTIGLIASYLLALSLSLNQQTSNVTFINNTIDNSKIRSLLNTLEVTKFKEVSNALSTILGILFLGIIVEKTIHFIIKRILFFFIPSKISIE